MTQGCISLGQESKGCNKSRNDRWNRRPGSESAHKCSDSGSAIQEPSRNTQHPKNASSRRGNWKPFKGTPLNVEDRIFLVLIWSSDVHLIYYLNASESARHWTRYNSLAAWLLSMFQKLHAQGQPDFNRHCALLSRTCHLPWRPVWVWQTPFRWCRRSWAILSDFLGAPRLEQHAVNWYQCSGRLDLLNIYLHSGASWKPSGAPQSNKHGANVW